MTVMLSRLLRCVMTEVLKSGGKPGREEGVGGEAARATARQEPAEQEKLLEGRAASVLTPPPKIPGPVSVFPFH